MIKKKVNKSFFSSKLLFFRLLGILSILSALYVGYVIGNNQDNKSQNFKEIAITIVSPTPTPTPTPTVVVIPQPQKVALHIDSIDWIDGHAAGLITSDIKVQLFTMDGRLIEEKTPSAYVQNGPVGSGGDTIFYVIPSTYYIRVRNTI